MSSLKKIVIAVSAALLVLPAVALADTYQTYEKCSPASCPVSGQSNEKGTKIGISVSIDCEKSGSAISGASSFLKVNKKTGKFKGTFKLRSFDKDDQDYIVNDTEGTMTLTGKLKKKKKITGDYAATGLSPGCVGSAAGSFTAKYSGKTIR